MSASLSPRKANQAAGTHWLRRLVLRFSRQPCSHEFDINDLDRTNIPEIPDPGKDGYYSEWVEYFSKYWKQPAFTERIEWPCWKCGKKFRGGYGLEILSKVRGKMSSQNAYSGDPGQHNRKP